MPASLSTTSEPVLRLGGGVALEGAAAGQGWGEMKHLGGVVALEGAAAGQGWGENKGHLNSMDARRAFGRLARHCEGTAMMIVRSLLFALTGVAACSQDPARGDAAVAKDRSADRMALDGPLADRLDGPLADRLDGPLADRLDGPLADRLKDARCDLPPAHLDALPLDGGAAAQTIWIAPQGKDSNGCLSKADACKTWNQAVAVAVPHLGKVAVTIRFACGTYAAGSYLKEPPRFIGLPTLAGTAAAPITVEAEQPRCATLQGDGRGVFEVMGARYLTISGLRLVQVDACTQPTSCYATNKNLYPSCTCTYVGSGSCSKSSQCQPSVAGCTCICQCANPPAEVTLGAWGTLTVLHGDHITIRGCEVVKNNRYYNTQGIYIFSSDHLQVEGNRIYGSHRHLVTLSAVYRCGGLPTGKLCGGTETCPTGTSCLIVPSDGAVHSVLAENYVNGCAAGPNGPVDCATYSADIPDFGWASHSGLLADECFSTYYANDVAVINNIAENCEHLGANIGYGGGDNNLYSNNVMNKYLLGYITTANSGTGGAASVAQRTADNTGKGNRLVNNVAIGAWVYGSLLRDGDGTIFENNTIIRSNTTDIPGTAYDPAAQSGKRPGVLVDWTKSVTSGTPPCAAPPTSVTLNRNFIAGTPGASWSTAFSFNNVCTVTGDHNAYCDTLGSCTSGTSPIYTIDTGTVTSFTWTNPHREVDPGLLSQYVFIPAGDPRATAAGGKRLGADIRCLVDASGQTTTHSYWDRTSGPFADNPLGVVDRLLGGGAPPSCP